MAEDGKKPVALEQREQAADGRMFSPSTARNRDVVRAAFFEHMPTTGRILEIGSGTGEHGAHITEAAEDLEWVYSDLNPESRRSQRGWAGHAGHGRLLGPYEIDAASTHWGEAEALGPFDGVFCANVVHISPFEVAQGLLRGAGRTLSDGGEVFLYGPFARNGAIAPSNQRFSDDLKRGDPAWGVRDLDLELVPEAETSGLKLSAVIEMPANNLSVIFARG